MERLQKKGQKQLTGKMTTLIGAVIIIFLVVALAPEIFSELAGMVTDTNVPTWVSSVMLVVVGAGLVFIVWRTFNN